VRLLVAARNRTVAIEGGRIVAPEGRFDLELSVPDADVRPGLINAHDHLHRNHYGRLGAPPYRNAYQWARDIQARHRAHIAERHAMPRRGALLVGAWKNLFAGVTSVVHHDAWDPDFGRDFPLRVLRVASADSLGMTGGRITPPPGQPFCLHLAEGIDEDAAAEVPALNAMGLLSPSLIAVHGVGMDGDGIARFRASGAALVWCPTSNQFLFGRTAPDELLRDGLDVLLGSDSLLTGTGDLLDELRHARALGTLSDERLEDAVGATAARRLGIAPPSLEPGAPADLVLLTRPLLEARREDVVLVIARGIPRVARSDLADRLNRLTPRGALMHIGPVSRWTNGHAAMAVKGRPLE
jgi:cytosine/adenosine deaminase-related metal-dependent hydrolase